MAFRLSHPGATTRPRHRHGRASASQKVTAALLAASIFFISGCGIGTQNPGSTSASSHSVVDGQTTKSELENLAQEQCFFRSEIADGSQQREEHPRSSADG